MHLIVIICAYITDVRAIFGRIHQHIYISCLSGIFAVNITSNTVIYLLFFAQNVWNLSNGQPNWWCIELFYCSMIIVMHFRLIGYIFAHRHDHVIQIRYSYYPDKIFLVNKKRPFNPRTKLLK